MTCIQTAFAGIIAAMTLTLASTATAQGAPAEPLRVYSAGSLRQALTEIAGAYERETGQRVALTFGASGLLRERIEKGEPAQVFTSADTQHPQKLASSSAEWQAPVRFVRNRLCALATPAINANPDNLLDLMLSPQIRLGTSTPLADPSGDYAWELFRKAEGVRPGAYAPLDAKALQLTGSANSPQPPAGRTVYPWLMEEGKADLVLTYCTNAVAAKAESPRLVVVAIPPTLEVRAQYGMTTRSGDAAATRFATYLLSPGAQGVFSRLGFGAP